jgi:hypothetical protein
MNPFDGLTKKQHMLVKLALDYMRLLSWGGEMPKAPEVLEYDELLAMLKEANVLPDSNN